ncbi:MAG: response regulator transcription factor [Chloroflexota bacterium]
MTRTERRIVRALIGVDGPLIRKGIATCLEAQGGYEVVGSVPADRALLELAPELAPDVVIVEADPSLDSHTSCLNDLQEAVPEACLLLFTDSAEKRSVLHAFSQGIVGFLPKTAATEDDLARAVDAVSSGRRFVGGPDAEEIVEEALKGLPPANQQAPGERERLSDRESEVLQLLAAGHSTREIAAKLRISPHTVRTLIQRMMSKLDIHSRVGLVRYVLEQRPPG